VSQRDSYQILGGIIIASAALVVDLWNILARDVSVFASCQSLRMLNLSETHVSDVSALASCQSLHALKLLLLK
jgi:hypothetical protein